MDKKLVQVSKFLSLVLRHQPEKIGLGLDEQGWAEIDELIRLANDSGNQLDRQTLDLVVAQNEKQRFAITEDGCRIRANQGHSVVVDLGLAPSTPPSVLFHGTANTNLPSIRAAGLLKGKRQHVHLSLDEATAIRVGQRHGKPVVLSVRSGAMYDAGFCFFLSENGVWLTDRVPPEYIGFPENVW